MSGIPEFQQKRLASQRVGTPGVDLSQAKLFGTLATVSGKFERRAEQERLVERQAQARQDKLRTQALVDSRSAMGIVDFNNELDVLKGNSKDINEYSESAKALLQERVDDIEDDNLRAQFSEDASKLLIGKNSKFAKDFKQQETDEIKTNTDRMIDSGAGEISAIFRTFDSLGGKVEDSSAITEITLEAIDRLAPGLGTTETTRLKKEAMTTYIKAAIGGLLDSNPEDVNKFLDEAVKGNKQLATLIPPEELNELKDYASDLFKARKEQAKTLNNRTKEATATTWANRAADNDFPTEEEMNTAILNGQATQKDVKAIRDLKRSNKKFFLGDTPAQFNELTEDFSSIGITQIAGPGDTEEASLSKLASFRQKTLEAMESGSISMEDGKRWLKQIQPKFGEGVAELFKEINKKSVPGTLWGTNEVPDIIDPDDRADAIMSLQRELMDRIDKKENAEGRRLRMSEVKEIRDDISLDAVLLRGSELFSFELGQIFTMPDGIPVKVTGFKKDGQVITNDDLNAPIKQEQFFTKDKKRK